jgi:hypothetical protein
MGINKTPFNDLRVLCVSAVIIEGWGQLALAGGREGWYNTSYPAYSHYQ